MKRTKFLCFISLMMWRENVYGVKKFLERIFNQHRNLVLVCEKPFDENFIIRIDKAKRPDGTILSVKRDRPKLTADAFPSIFPMCPSYLLSSVATKGKAPDDRRNEQTKRDNESFFNWIEADKIHDFEKFSDFFKERVDNNVWLYKLCCFEETTGPLQCWSIYKVMDFVDSSPRLSCAIKIFSDLHVEIFTEKMASRLSGAAVGWMFTKSSPCMLTSWSQFDTLMSHFSRGDGLDCHSFEVQMNIHLSAINLILCNDEEREDDSKSKDHLYLFILEKIKLVRAPLKSSVPWNSSHAPDHAPDPDVRRLADIGPTTPVPNFAPVRGAGLQFPDIHTRQDLKKVHGKTIDLHNLYLRDAMLAVESFIEKMEEEYFDGGQNRKDRFIFIITGHGMHSKNGVPVIKPNVENFLKGNSYKYEFVNLGKFKVDLLVERDYM
ncbi:nedd4-binding 2 2-like protein [Plakobranchus ocellatus]|uniref:Nedd4-binding 2 2-like protein n=1 Tax=Plakobranchus ocellatus TaxID=259542 RepID=A0AAV4ACR5_9GAST|nr:nedd4-binding 2 2-like protein [Plakobranchus ocellatus]